jgi:DNA replication licensing factor MCM4
VFRAIPRRPNPKQRVVNSVYKTYLDIIHIKRTDVSADEVAAPDEGLTLTGPEEDVTSSRHFSAARIAEFRAFAEQGG